MRAIYRFSMPPDSGVGRPRTDSFLGRAGRRNLVAAPLAVRQNHAVGAAGFDCARTELLVVEPSIDTAGFYEFLMGSRLDDLAMVDHVNHIG